MRLFLLKHPSALLGLELGAACDGSGARASRGDRLRQSLSAKIDPRNRLEDCDYLTGSSASGPGRREEPDAPILPTPQICPGTTDSNTLKVAKRASADSARELMPVLAGGIGQV